MINSVEIKELVIHTDARGSFTELIRKHDAFFNNFGQWSESVMNHGVIKAWHIHNIQYDYWHVGFGVIRAVLCDLRKDSETIGQIDEYLMGDAQKPIILKIPPGVAHGLKVLQGPAMLSYIPVCLSLSMCVCLSHCVSASVLCVYL